MNAEKFLYGVSKPYKIKTFGYPKMMLQLEVEYKSGKKETIIMSGLEQFFLN